MIDPRKEYYLKLVQTLTISHPLHEEETETE